jgi:hypothetical protein
MAIRFVSGKTKVTGFSIFRGQVIIVTGNDEVKKLSSMYT